MPYNPDIHHRRSIRLRNYDYASAGAYFITICVEQRLCLFGNVNNGEMILNGAGQMVEAQWLGLPQRFPTIELDSYVVMPNHFHGILVLWMDSLVGAPLVGALTHATDPIPDEVNRAGTSPAPTLGNILGAFKSLTTVEYIRGITNSIWEPFNKRLWQRNYYEHVIRDAEELAKTQYYIETNPEYWAKDRHHPAIWRD